MSDFEYAYSEEFSSDGEENRFDEVSESDRRHRNHTPRRSGNARSEGAVQSYAQHLPYQVLQPHQINELQEELIESLCDVLGVSREASRRLLMSNKWDKELVTERFLAGGETFLKQSGVFGPERDSLAIPEMCLICAEPFNNDSFEKNEFCGHTFCQDCWQQHSLIQTKQGAADRIRCMMQGCNCFMAIALTRHLFKDGENSKLFERALVESFISENPRVQWCPSIPCCGCAINIRDSSTQTEYECSCEEVFCFACHGLSHLPAPCEWARTWTSRFEKDAPTMHYIASNCKQCPGCFNQIEKNKGCNHISCKCGTSFCWLCGQKTGRAHDWNRIFDHTCVAHREPVDGKTPEAIAARRMETYLFYLNHYQSNMRSRDLENKQQPPRTGYDFEHIGLGRKQLARMRLLVSWAFVVAFNAFFEENGERIKATEAMNGGGAYYYQTLYEDLLSQLQQTVEKLSTALDSSNNKVSSEDRKLEILTLIHTTQSQANNLHKFVIDEILPRSLPGNLDIAQFIPLRKVIGTLGLKLNNNVVSNNQVGYDATTTELVDLTEEDASKKMRLDV